MQAVQLSRTHRILVGVVVTGAVVIAAIGFAGSYAAVRELAASKGFGAFAPFFPIGIDAGIVVLLALDLLLTWIRIPFPLLRQTAWLLTAATIAFNGAAAWPDPLGVGMHAVIPVLFVVSVEAARHAIGRIADITADRHMEGVRISRWLLAFPSTFRLWRRMKLWELRSYDQVIRMEQDRLVYEARLRARFGRAWRRKAPVEALMPLRLARYGVPLAETGPAGLASAGIAEPLRTAAGRAALPGPQAGADHAPQAAAALAADTASAAAPDGTVAPDLDALQPGRPARPPRATGAPGGAAAPVPQAAGPAAAGSAGAASAEYDAAPTLHGTAGAAGAEYGQAADGVLGPDETTGPQAGAASAGYGGSDGSGRGAPQAAMPDGAALPDRGPASAGYDGRPGTASAPQAAAPAAHGGSARADGAAGTADGGYAPAAGGGSHGGGVSGSPQAAVSAAGGGEGRPDGQAALFDGDGPAEPSGVTVPVSPGRSRALGGDPGGEPDDDAGAGGLVGMPEDTPYEDVYFEAFRRYVAAENDFPSARQLARALHDRYGVTHADGSLLSESYLRSYTREFRDRLKAEVNSVG